MLTDDQVRAELERIMGFETSDYFDTLSILDGLKKEEEAAGGKKYWLNFHYKYLRRLAESQQALGEIADILMGQCKSPYGHGPEPNIDTEYPCEGCKKIKKIARKAVKGGK